METKTFRNRYDLNYKFEELEPHKFEFIIGGANYMRSGVDESGVIVFFDPEGGPFIHVGDILPEINKKVTAINFTESRVYIWTEDV